MTEPTNDDLESSELTKDKFASDSTTNPEIEKLYEKYDIPRDIDMEETIDLLQWVYNRQNSSKDKPTISEQEAHSGKVAKAIRKLINLLSDADYGDGMSFRRRFEHVQSLSNTKEFKDNPDLQFVRVIEFSEFIEWLSQAGRAFEEDNDERRKYYQKFKKENPGFFNKGHQNPGLWQTMANLERIWMSLPDDGEPREFKKYLVDDKKPGNQSTQFVVDIMRLIAPDIKQSAVTNCMKKHTQN